MCEVAHLAVTTDVYIYLPPFFAINWVNRCGHALVYEEEKKLDITHYTYHQDVYQTTPKMEKRQIKTAKYLQKIITMIAQDAR